MGDPSAGTLVNLNGSVVRTRFGEVTTGIKGAIDFLKRNLHVEKLDNLPYANILVPLSVYFAGPANKQHRMTDRKRKEIIRWFWRTCFGRRYNSQPIKSMREDVVEMQKLKSLPTARISTAAVHLDSDFYLINTFRVNSVLSKTYVLQLAQMSPRSFVSGQKMDLRDALKEYNRNEFHHIYPKSYLKTSSSTGPDESCFANICFMSKADNNVLGGVAPSAYRLKMPSDITEIEVANALPSGTFTDDYASFTRERAAVLAAHASTLIQ